MLEIIEVVIIALLLFIIWTISDKAKENIKTTGMAIFILVILGGYGWLVYHWFHGVSVWEGFGNLVLGTILLLYFVNIIGNILLALLGKK